MAYGNSRPPPSSLQADISSLVGKKDVYAVKPEVVVQDELAVVESNNNSLVSSYSCSVILFRGLFVDAFSSFLLEDNNHDDFIDALSSSQFEEENNHDNFIDDLSSFQLEEDSNLCMLSLMPLLLFYTLT